MQRRRQKYRIGEANKNIGESTKILVNGQKCRWTRKILLYIGKILLCIRKILFFSAHTYNNLLHENITKHINTDQRTIFREKNYELKHFANKHLISSRIECTKKRKALFLEKIIMKISKINQNAG